MSIRIDGMLPETYAAYEQIVQALLNHGYSATLADFGGFRTAADTALILGYRQADFAADVAAGRVSADTTLQQYRPIAPYGSSYHDYGAAFDLSASAAALAFAGQLAPSYGLKWGKSFGDPAHFQLNVTLEDARAMYAAAGGDVTSSAPDITDETASVGMGNGLLVAGIALVGGLVVYAIRRRFLS